MSNNNQSLSEDITSKYKIHVSCVKGNKLQGTWNIDKNTASKKVKDTPNQNVFFYSIYLHSFYITVEP